MKDKLRKHIITVSLVISLILYITGIYTGIKISSFYTKDLNNELIELKSLIDESALDVKNIQLQQFIMFSLDEEKKCDFLNNYLDLLYKQLYSYWTILPSRLETYESQNQLSEEYISLKREYIRFSIRYYFLANQAISCDSNYIPILYFYSQDCDKCISQALEFDEFKKNNSRLVLIFPVDINFDDDNVFLLKKLYNISTAPVVVFNDKVFENKVITVQELENLVYENS